MIDFESLPASVLNAVSGFFMNHATLICVALFIVSMVYYGKRKGFMTKLLSLCSVVMTLAIELYIYPVVMDFINNNETISEFMRGIGARMLDIVAAAVTGSMDADIISESAAYGAYASSSSPAYSQLDLASSPLYDFLGLDLLAENAAALAADVAARILCFVVIFIAIRLIVRMLMLIVRGLKSIYLIDWLDCTLGGAFGFAEAVIYVWLFMFIISGFPGYAFTDFVLGQIQGSAVLSFIYSQNLILRFFMDMLL